MSDPLLSIRGLRARFDGENGDVWAVDGVSFEVERGETVCLVGESGSGKTVTCEAITRLVSADLDGEIRFDGQNLLDYSEKQLRAVRGSEVAHVFQNPQGALDPVYSVGQQLREAIERNRDESSSDDSSESADSSESDESPREVAIDLLDRVGIPKAATRYDDYPHEFSGGQKQRVVIAMALAGDPDLIVADEPTTALDVTIQAQILDLLRELQDERDVGVLFVTHDLGVAAQVADRIVVMYAGKVMERGGVSEIFDSPGHPYTRALFRCLPGWGSALDPIPGDPIDPADPPEGCRFHPRCSASVAECETGNQPELYDADGGRVPETDIHTDFDTNPDLDGDTNPDLDGDTNPDLDGDTNPAPDHCVSCVFYGPDRSPDEIEAGTPPESARVTEEGDDD